MTRTPCAVIKRRSVGAVAGCAARWRGASGSVLAGPAGPVWRVCVTSSPRGGRVKFTARGKPFSDCNLAHPLRGPQWETRGPVVRFPMEPGVQTLRPSRAGAAGPRATSFPAPSPADTPELPGGQSRQAGLPNGPLRPVPPRPVPAGTGFLPARRDTGQALVHEHLGLPCALAAPAGPEPRSAARREPAGRCPPQPPTAPSCSLASEWTLGREEAGPHALSRGTQRVALLPRGRRTLTHASPPAWDKGVPKVNAMHWSPCGPSAPTRAATLLPSQTSCVSGRCLSPRFTPSYTARAV